MQTGLVSVIMPVYNTPEAYLRAAIDSILNQSYSNLELLVVDDCSSDPSICKLLASYSDHRLKTHKLKTNSGAAIARNHGLASAKGEYIAFMDSDDISSSDRLEKQINFLNKNNTIDIVGSAYSNTKNNKVVHPSLDDKTLKTRALFGRCPFLQSSVLAKRTAFFKEEKTFSYNPDHNTVEDYALWLDVMDHAQFANIKTPLVTYRWHGGNISITQNVKQRRMTIHTMIEKWNKRYILQTPDYIKLFLQGDECKSSYAAGIEAYFLQLITEIKNDKQITTHLGIKYLSKLYCKALRNSKSGAIMRSLLKSSLAKELKISPLFKAKTYVISYTRV